MITKAKSLYRSPAVGDFYGTGIEIWAGFAPVSSTEKKRFGPIMSNFLGRSFQVFMGKKPEKVKTL